MPEESEPTWANPGAEIAGDFQADASPIPALVPFQRSSEPTAISDMLLTFIHLGVVERYSTGIAMSALGFEAGEAPTTESVLPPTPEATPAPPVTTPASSLANDRPASPPPPPLPILFDPEIRPETELELLEPVGYLPSKQPAEDLTSAPPLKLYLPEAHDAPLPYLVPLIPPPRDRAILTALASAWHPGREIDLDRVVELLAMGRSISSLPRRQIRAVARQVLLLIDLGDGMMPYRRDQTEFASALRSTIGEEVVTVLHFEVCPTLDFVTTDDGASQPFQYPATATPIIVLSDLGAAPGIGASFRRRDEAWSAFATECQNRGCPVVVLNPYLRRRWPPNLDRRLVILEWDSTTSVSAALQPILKFKRGARSAR